MNLYSTFLFEAGNQTPSNTLRMFLTPQGRKGQGFNDSPTTTFDTNMMKASRLDYTLKVERVEWSCRGGSAVEEAFLAGLRWSFETQNQYLQANAQGPRLTRRETFPLADGQQDMILPAHQLWAVVFKYPGTPILFKERVYLRCEIFGSR